MKIQEIIEPKEINSYLLAQNKEEDTSVDEPLEKEDELFDNDKQDEQELTTTTEEESSEEALFDGDKAIDTNKAVDTNGNSAAVAEEDVDPTKQAPILEYFNFLVKETIMQVIKQREKRLKS